MSDVTSFEQYIKNFFDKQDIDFKSKPQKVGTCVFANAKSLLLPILCMLKIPVHHAEYKKFTSWMRTHELKTLIAKYMLSKNSHDTYTSDQYATLIQAYIKKQRSKPNAFNPSIPENYAFNTI